jgi:hypothetical protein
MMPSNHHTEISSLTTPDEEHSKRCRLEIREQPVAAVQSCGLDDENGEAIHPPPIVELIMEGQDVAEKPGKYKYVMDCSVHEEIDAQGKLLTSCDRQKQQPLLGTWVTEPSTVVDQDKSGKKFYIFTFPNLLCQTIGRSRLRFRWARIDLDQAVPGKTHPFLGTIDSEPFVCTSAESPKQRHV